MTTEQARTIAALREQNRSLAADLAQREVELAVLKERTTQLELMMDAVRELFVRADRQALHIARPDGDQTFEACESCEHALGGHVLATFGDAPHDGIARICATAGCECFKTGTQQAPPDVMAELRTMAQHTSAEEEEFNPPA